MEYTRPDMLKFSAVLNKSCDTALEQENIEVVEDAIWEFYAVYDEFYTSYYLAMLEYSRDLTDIYWEEEYNYCITHATEADAGLDRLYRSLAQSPIREILDGDDYFGAGYLDSYEGESIYDDHLTELLTQESGLCAQYQALVGEAASVEYYSDAYFTEYGSQMAQLFLQLVELRQQIAAYVGYEDYVSFAYDFYHVRDYTPQQTAGYLADIRAELVPLYQQTAQSGIWKQELPTSTEEKPLLSCNPHRKTSAAPLRKLFLP
jgi:AraC-like DNA-binding protein